MIGIGRNEISRRIEYRRHGYDDRTDIRRTANGRDSFVGATFDDLDETTKLAWAAFPIYHETGFEQRAAFLGKDCRTDCQYR